jgi:hypothetical protein
MIEAFSTGLQCTNISNSIGIRRTSVNNNKFALSVLAVTVALSIALGGCSPAPAASLAQGSPQVVVEGFYRWHTGYPGNALADGAYRSSEYLTEGFIQRVDALIASFEDSKGGYDPFLCAQDVPGTLTIGKVDVTGEMASVELNEIWNPGTEHEMVSHALVKLRQIDGTWLIDDVWCLEPDPLAPVSDPPEATTPEEAVQGFYDWYLAASAYDESAGTRLSPLTDGRYRSSEYLTEGFVQQVDEIIASFDKGGYDPFLCAQDVPESFTVGEAVVFGDTATLAVHTSFEGHGFTVALQRVDGLWRVSDVLCAGTEAASDLMEGWQVFADEKYGFQVRFPGDWTYEESPPVPSGMEVPDGQKALKRVLFFQPQAWDGVAPPLHIQVTEGTEQEFERLYVPATSVQNVELNGCTVVKAIEDVGGIHVIRYIFQSPNDGSVRVVALDYIGSLTPRLFWESLRI